MKMMSYSCIPTVILVSYMCYVQGQLQCTTPTNRKGSCIPINNCSRLFALSTNAQISNEQTKLLKDSQCGADDSNSTMVCCETERLRGQQCFTYEGNEGTCINIRLCPYLQNMLKPPNFAYNRNYVNSHRCDDADEERVCCVNCNSLRGPPNPKTGCCGRDILGENPDPDTVVTSVYQYPWMVLLEYETKNNVTEFHCGGGKYVLSVAHCFKIPRLPQPKRVRVGEYDISIDGPDCVEVGGKLECTDGAISVPIETVHIHHSYKKPKKTHDISLLRLQYDVPYTDFIRPICLPMLDLEMGEHTFYTVGFGVVDELNRKSNKKLHVDLPFVPSEVCKTIYKKNRIFSFGEEHICVGGIEGRGTCFGDSGGPVMSYNGFYELVGLVSYESQCTTPTNRKGRCIPIKSCSRLLALVTNAQRSNEQIKLLKDSQCGTDESNSPMVCCETEPLGGQQCFTYEGNEGTCINIRLCPFLQNMLKPPNFAYNRNYVNSHRCDDADEERVCCVNCNSLRGPPNPKTGCCGKDILGEKPDPDTVVTSVYQYPWMVLLEYEGEDNITAFHCGGVLISSKYVLSVAHCFTRIDTVPKRVRVGEYDTSVDGPDCVEVGGKLECTDGAISVPIETVHIHHSYNNRKKSNDIALLRLQYDVPYTDFIRPICLPMLDLEEGEHTLYTVGFGAVDEKQRKSNKKIHVDVPFIPSEECKKVYEGIRLFSIGEGHICAGGIRGRGACIGDSGGPLMSYNRFYELIGLVSFGKGCGVENIPDIFTKVYHHLPWIRSHIKP